MPHTAIYIERGKQLIDAFWQHGRPEDLAEAVQDYRSALALVANDDVEPSCVAELGLVEALHLQLEEGHISRSRLHGCITLAEHVVERTDNKSSIYYQATLVLARLILFKARPDPTDSSHVGDLGRAVEMLEKCMKTPDLPNLVLVELLSVYAWTFSEQWAASPEEDIPLNKSNDVMDRALSLVAEDRLPPYSVLSLSRCRWRRGMLKRRTEDFDQCIRILKHALNQSSPDHPWAVRYWSHLSACYGEKSLLQSSSDDLASAIVADSHARRLVTESHPLWGKIQGNFAVSLHERFVCNATLQDLDDAIHVLRSAVPRMTLENSTRTERTFFVNLQGCVLGTAYTQCGKLELLDEALQLQRANLSDTPSAYQCLNHSGLADTYALRFSLHGRFSDLELAINHLRDGLSKCLPSRVDYRLIASRNLGDNLITRFNERRDPDDISEALSVLHLSLTYDDPSQRDHGLNQSLLGWAYLSRFIANRRRTDLFRSLRAQEAALQLLPKAHVQRSLVHFRIGMTLLHMPQHTSEHSPLYAAIASFDRALRSLSEVHAQRGMILLKVGEARLALADADKDTSIEDAITTFRRVALDKHCSNTDRFAGAIQWARAAYNHQDPCTALEGYRCAVNLLPQMAWIGLEHDLRMRRLAKQTLGLSSDAAACAIETDQWELAIELLEQSRSVMWNTSQELRADLGRLKEVDSQLAQELGEVGAALQYRPSFQGPDIKDQDFEVERQRQHRLAAKWTELIEKTRQIPSFERFLAPLSYESLRHAARRGPVIIVNTSDYRCDALIIPSPDQPIHHVPLPTLYNAQVMQSVQYLRYALSVAKDKRGMRYLENAFVMVLRHLWGAVGLPIYTALAQYLDASNNRRVWWCPIGAISLLPLHACGPLDGSYPDMAELVISSYTPTLSALVRSADSYTKTRSVAFDILVVSQADAPGHPPLLCAKEERDVLRQLFPSTGSFIDGQEGTIARVQELIANHKWLHICCHGTQRADAPLDSALHLHDGPLTLRHLTQSALPNAEFAFLSACHSARGDAGIPDESLHLAAGLLFSGFRGVVATQWSIADKDAPQVTRKFYSHLLRKGERPVPEDAAEALHWAVNVLRKSGVPPFRWAPFIHVGV